MIFSPPHLLDCSRWSGMRVGLLGGSFNPPHHGHVHISMIALNALQLDAVWWLVTPQNPLKEELDLSFDKRFELSQEITAPYPKLIISDLEVQLKTNITWRTIKELKKRFSKTELIWLMGMDNALTIHKWENWKEIIKHVPTAHFSRPPALTLINNCPLKMLRSQTHRHIQKGEKVSLLPHQSYWLMQKKMMQISSTEIRSSHLITST